MPTCSRGVRTTDPLAGTFPHLLALFVAHPTVHCTVEGCRVFGPPVGRRLYLTETQVSAIAAFLQNEQNTTFNLHFTTKEPKPSYTVLTAPSSIASQQHYPGEVNYASRGNSEVLRLQGLTEE